MTRLNYCYDLRIFFDFLVKKRIRGKQVTDLTLEDLERVTDTDIEIYLSYLSNYTFRGRRLSCDERAKARKLSAVRSLFKYFLIRGLSRSTIRPRSLRLSFMRKRSSASNKTR